MQPRVRGCAEGLLVALLLVMVVGCAGGQATHTRAPTGTSTLHASTPTVTATPAISRVPYPWPMTATKTDFGTTIYRPADPAVKQEMQADFLTYWLWSGHAKPAEVLHFVPDVSQISRLATAGYAGHLQAYARQVETSGRLVTYTGEQFIQNISSCSRDGLQCSTVYAFGVTVKTVYSTRDGMADSTTEASNFFVNVAVLQVYNRELHLWQIGSAAIREFTV